MNHDFEWNAGELGCGDLVLELRQRVVHACVCRRAVSYGKKLTCELIFKSKMQKYVNL